MKRAFYPPLVAAFLVLALFNANSALITSASQVSLPLLISIGGACALWALMRLILGSWNRAALPSSILTIMLLEYGHFRGILGLTNNFTLMLWLAGFGLVIITMMIIKKPPTLVLNVLAIGLVLTVLAPFCVFTLQRHITPSTSTTIPKSITNSYDLPSIYHIMPDSYAGKPTMDYLGIDNSEFYQFLEREGFTINHNSVCNYATTSLSVASVLSMNYLEPNLTLLETQDIIASSPVGQRLQDLGYYYTHIGPTKYYITATSSIADETLLYDANEPLHTEFMAALLNLTPFADNTLVDNGPSYAYRLICRDAIREQLWMLEQTAKKDNGGRYVFCHILLPHHNEYMFDENERLPLPAISVGGSLEGYTNHLSYITRRLTEVIKLIPEDAIIILQADTGYVCSQRDAPDFLTAGSAYTLSAIRLPNSNYVPESLVNTYRLLLNEPLLPDRFCFTRVVSGVGRAYETPTGECIEVGQ